LIDKVLDFRFPSTVAKATTVVYNHSESVGRNQSAKRAKCCLINRGGKMSAKVQGSDPRVKRTRQILAQAFRQLLGEKGFDAMTVQDITARAEVNRATFYAHFADKFALLEQIIHDSFQQVVESKLPVDPVFSLDHLQLLIVTVCEHLADFRNLQCRASSKQFEPLVEKEVQCQVYQLVLRWVKALPMGKPQSTPEVTAAAISWTILGAGMHWSQNEQQTSLKEIVDQVLLLITKGLYGTFGPELQ
jgi:AcrR family transcriptional regulator